MPLRSRISALKSDLQIQKNTSENWCCVTENGGWRWIRTIESIASRFTVCPLWPLGNPAIIYIFLQSFVSGINGAGNGSRTRISSLEGWCTAVMPYPQKISEIFEWLTPWFAKKMVPSVGVEPTFLAEHGPEPCASANSATTAYRLFYQLLHCLVHVINIPQSLYNANLKTTFFRKKAHFFSFLPFICLLPGVKCCLIDFDAAVYGT